MTKTEQSRLFLVVAAAVLALCLLVLVAAGPAEAAFPGKNGKIAFERGTKIWMKNPSLDSAETKLRDETTSDVQPAFSPDGSRVAFMRSNEIYVANTDGSGTPRNLTNSPLLDWNPAWSHDGTRIVFERRGSDNAFNIWTMNADGTGEPTQLTSDGLKSAPAWSVPVPGAPDGKIVYRHSAADLWTMDPDGTDKKELVFSCPTDNGGVCDNSVGIPTFSPDGTKVAFDYSGDIYWTYSSGVDPNGGLIPTAYPILRDKKGTETTIDDTEYPGAEVNATWSPDGTKIAFQHNGNVPGSPYDIYTANADGSSTTASRITSGSLGASNPDWQQDSIPSQTTIASGSSGTVKSTSASFSFVSNETGSTFQCSLDGAAFSACASPKSYTNLKNGSHTFKARAIDAPGNVDATPAVRSWKVDAIKPTVSGMSPKHKSIIRDTTPTIKATVKDNMTNLAKGNIKLYVAGKAIPASKYSYNRTTDQLVYNSPRLSKGKKTVRIVATDAAKNVGARSWYFTIR